MSALRRPNPFEHQPRCVGLACKSREWPATKLTLQLRFPSGRWRPSQRLTKQMGLLRAFRLSSNLEHSNVDVRPRMSNHFQVQGQAGGPWNDFVPQIIRHLLTAGEGGLKLMVPYHNTSLESDGLIWKRYSYRFPKRPPDPQVKDES